MPRPLRASIHLAALRHNLTIARKNAPRSSIMAVIKANGYGHGMLRVAKALDAADGFAVLTTNEAIALREAGFRQDILLLEGFFSTDEIPLLAHHRLSAVIHAPWQIDALLQSNTANLKVWLKINSGMNRLGIQADELPAALQRLGQIKADVTLMTHFARADEVDGISGQFQLFNSLTQGLQLPRSLANSAALLNFPETQYEWVRPGIMLYGASPTSHQSASALGLLPAMTLRSEIIAVHEIQAGDAVGYGASFRAGHAMRIGTVACGYADGYPRHAPTGTPVLIDGIRSRIIGRVSMDMLSVDLSAIPKAQVGSYVTLWGEGLPVDEVATSAGTISYELLCALAPRVPIFETA